MISEAEQHVLRLGGLVIAHLGCSLIHDFTMPIEVSTKVAAFDERGSSDPHTLEQTAAKPPEHGVPGDPAELRHVGRP